MWQTWAITALGYQIGEQEVRELSQAMTPPSATIERFTIKGRTLYELAAKQDGYMSRKGYASWRVVSGKQIA